MFLIVIIKAKSGYIKCGLLLIALLRQGIKKLRIILKTGLKALVGLTGINEARH